MKISAPGESSLLLLNVIKVLKACRIPYAIVGAFAASFYGVVRASLDADAVISIEGSEEKLNKFVSALKKSALKIELRQSDVEDPVRGVMNITDGFGNRVDLLTGIRGMRQDVFERVVTASFMNRMVNIIGIEDFVAMKRFAGGAKDIQDVSGVLQISIAKINMALLKELTLRYGKQELQTLEKMLNRK